MTVKNVVVLAVAIGAVIWFLNRHPASAPQFVPAVLETDAGNFHCEGKKRCSQMTSCEEATFYLKNCPGTEMDGDEDGIPCESQHCGH